MANILTDRSVLAVHGVETRSFLQGLVTCDMEMATQTQAAFGGLLTPQGKLLFDFLAIQHDAGFLLDVPRQCAEEFKKRLSFYKLRAKITIEDLSTESDDAFAVAAVFDGDAPKDAVIFDDPRAGILGRRALAPKKLFGASSCDDETLYHDRRIDACAPLGGLDFSYGDVFPTDVNMDLLHGIAFDKGCYVGQEVVSRMKHRGLIRRRTLRVDCEGAPPPPDAEIRANGQLIGQMGGAIGYRGLALIRIDRLAEAGNAPLLCGDAILTVASTQDILS